MDLWNIFGAILELSLQSQNQIFPLPWSSDELAHPLVLLVGVEGLKQRRGWPCFAPVLSLAYELVVGGAG